MEGVHLAKVPTDTEQDVPTHDQTIGGLFVVGLVDSGQVSRLVQKIMRLDTQVERADVLGDFYVPNPLRKSETIGITW